MMQKHKQWWKGERGEWYVVIQAFLLLLVIYVPRSVPWNCGWHMPESRLACITAAVFMLAGVLLASAGTLCLGRNLTPMPHPMDGAPLIQSGPYRLVRHPIYSGILFMALGWSVWLQSHVKLGCTLLLFIFFDLKSRREERLLAQIFPEYDGYRKRVSRLVPFIY
jgi:protein-S-isoprenylcysteine O-methyltransferase Ste14